MLLYNLCLWFYRHKSQFYKFLSISKLANLHNNIIITYFNNFTVLGRAVLYKFWKNVTNNRVIATKQTLMKLIKQKLNLTTCLCRLVDPTLLHRPLMLLWQILLTMHIFLSQSHDTNHISDIYR